MKDDELEPVDPRELAEAEALARALESAQRGEGVAPDAPRDALESALLLRQSRGHGALPEARREAVLEALMKDGFVAPGAGREAKAQRGNVRWLRFGAVGGALAALAAAFLLTFTQQERVVMRAPAPAATSSAPAPAGAAAPGGAAAGSASAARGIPAPPAALLAAQAKLATGAPEAASELDAQMRAYRSTLFRSLEQRYPQTLGMLEVRR
jgi:hypothetical protein